MVGWGAASPPQGSLERPVPRSRWRGPHRLQRSYLGRPQRRRPRPQCTRPPQHSSILRGQGGKSTDGFKNANKTNIGEEAGGLAAGRGAPRQKHGKRRPGKPVLHSVPHPRARVSPGMAGHWTSDLGAGGGGRRGAAIPGRPVGGRGSFPEGGQSRHAALEVGFGQDPAALALGRGRSPQLPCRPERRGWVRTWPRSD